MMSSEMVNLNTKPHSYELPPEKKPDDIPSEKTSTSTPPTNNGIHNEKPIPNQFSIHQRVLYVSP